MIDTHDGRYVTARTRCDSCKVRYGPWSNTADTAMRAASERGWSVDGGTGITVCPSCFSGFLTGRARA